MTFRPGFLFLTVMFFVACGSPACSQKILEKSEDVSGIPRMIDDSLEFSGYQFKRKIIHGGEDEGVEISIRFRGRTVDRFYGMAGISDGESRRLNKIELSKMIPGTMMQAIVFLSDGGAQATGGFVVLSLGETGKIAELFDSEKYSLNQGCKVEDLNDDGYFELISHASHWYGLEDPGHMFVSRAYVEQVFVYDKVANTFVPANGKFWDYFESKISYRRGKVVKNDLKSVLEFASFFWFAGKTKEGWDEFNKYYSLGDRQEILEKVKGILAKEPYIQALGVR